MADGIENKPINIEGKEHSEQKLNIPEQKKQNLTPEQQKVFDKIQELKKLLEIIDNKKSFNGDRAKIIEINLQKDPEVKNDPEAKPTIELYQRYMRRFNEAVAKGGEIQEELNILEGDITSVVDDIEYKAGVNDNGEQLKYNNEDLKNISNKDFLSLSGEKRLQYITQNHIDSNNISSGVVKDLTFSFDQDGDGKINQDLYFLTTAGQVLPKEVREVSKDGMKYNRVGLTGEFYNGEKRLTIHDKTQISIDKIATEDELVQILELNQQKYSDYIDKNPEYKDEKYISIISAAVEKGIEIKNFMQVMSRRIEEFENQTLFEQAEIESIATEYTKIPGYENNDISSTTNVFMYMTPTTWKSNMIKCGFDHREVEKYAETNNNEGKYDFSKLGNFIPSEYSYPIERSSSGTTLCSKTARLNLTKLGVKNPSKGGNAKESWQKLGSPKDAFPPKDENVKVADIYLDARSSKNKQYGHRIAAFKEKGQWFILDPYYKMFGNTRTPIPAEKYINRVSDKQKVWGVKYY